MQSPFWQTEVLPEGLNFQIVVILCVQFLGTSVHVNLYMLMEIIEGFHQASFSSVTL